MEKYIALLRGINVGGKKIILMADLKKIFEDLHFVNVTTYIQSGNVVFLAPAGDELAIGKKIQSAIKKFYKFDAEVLVFALNDIIKIVKKNPYDENKMKDGERIYFTLLSNIPAKENVEQLLQRKNAIDDFQIIDRTLYLFCRKGYGTTIFNNNFVEKTLNVTATSRNLETMKKLIALGKSM